MPQGQAARAALPRRPALQKPKHRVRSPKAEIEEFYRRLADEPADPADRARIHQSLYAAGRGRAVGAGDRCRRQQARPRRCSRSPTRRRRCSTLGEERLIELIRTIGLFRTKARNMIELSRILVERVWRRGAARPRGAGNAAGGRAQDRERGAQRRVRRADDRGRHAYLPGRQPHRARARARRRSRSSKALEAVTPRRVQARRASLADPARPLCVQGAQAGVPGLRRRRSLPLRRQDTPSGVDCRTGCRAAQTATAEPLREPKRRRGQRAEE